MILYYFLRAFAFVMLPAFELTCGVYFLVLSYTQRWLGNSTFYWRVLDIPVELTDYA